jgi:hypothetical protein
VLNRIRGRLNYANIVASVALFMALGGVSYAAGTAAKNSVKSTSIGNGQVKNVDLGSNAVTSNKIKNNSVKGADILESSLSKVPSAGKADLATNASRLGGLAATAFVQTSALPPAPGAPLPGQTGSLAGNFSCAGSAWESAVSTGTYAITGSEKHGTAGAPLFRCSVALPDGVAITAVNFAVRDANPTDNADCDLYRTNMVTAVGGELLMANATTAGLVAPGNVQIGDTTVVEPTVDNGNYSYFVQCRTGADSTTGVFGATLTYAVASPGAAARLVPAPAGTAGSSSAR